MSTATQAALQPGFHSPLLVGLEAEMLREVVKAARPVRFHARQVVIHAGDVADRIFVLTSGQGQTYWVTEDGQRMILLAFGAGGIFGGEAILRKPISIMATTEITEDAEALAWSRETIRELACRYPVLFDNALMFAAELIQMLFAARVSMASETVEGRLAQALLDLSRRIGRRCPRGVEVQITNDELADVAHVSVYTASRVLSAWVRRGAIRHGRGKILILSEPLLTSGRQNAP